MRPATPLDPTLKSWPVPQYRHFPVLSFGPASTNDIRSTARSLEDIDAEVGSAETKRQNIAGKSHVRSLLEELHTLSLPSVDDEEREPDPTWRFYVFVTSYSNAALDNLSKAMTNWIELTRQDLDYYGSYGAEALRRLRMDVIIDAEKLSGASDDRIREELCAQIRGLQLSGKTESSPPGRYSACFVLDEEAIVKLAGLVLPEDPTHDDRSYSNLTVKLIDRLWDWRSLSNLVAYKGVRHCSITSLAELFELLVSNRLSLEEIHGLRHPFAP